MKHPLIIITVRSILIFLFAYTAVSKWFDRASFEAALRISPLIGNRAGAAATAVIAVELIAVLLLFLSLRHGLLLSMLLLTAFTAYLAYMLIALPHLPCSCGGVISSMGWKGHIAMNIALAILSFYAYRLLRKGAEAEKYYVIRRSRKPVTE